MKMNFKILLLLLLILSCKVSVLANYSNNYGDFSSRSIILQNLNNSNPIPQEEQILLKQKKLSPTIECLYEQAKKGNYENVLLLLKAKVNPNTSYLSDYPIYMASKNNHAEIVKLLIQYGAKLDKGFNSELFYSVKNKNAELSNFLLQNGAKANYRDSVTSNSILYYAVKNNMKDIARQLILKGASLDRKTAILIKKKKMQYMFDDLKK